MISLGEDTLSHLREQIRPYLTESRYQHTLGVEEEAARIGAIYLPDKIPKLRVAALLHDITKRDSLEKQLQYCEEFGIILEQGGVPFPKPLHASLHARTAMSVAHRDFADVADEEILSGVRWHTTGHNEMTVFESIVYLADYIEPNRTFDDCIAVREYFWNGIKDADDRKMLVVHLCKTMVYSFDLTLRALVEEGEPIAADTILARNCFLERVLMLEGK
ncbi:MAG: bis(5'-nucleosyl)-tetraphosphatase (symmetrical) YqeK [Clostridia bacterium]|nr:bis(5'-nucleosyl)-tetraphosphatase (symmetrical) YqeK [Clostridia bacterium]